MKHVGELSIDETIQALQDNELGFLLVQGESPNMYSILSEHVPYYQLSALLGTTTNASYYLYPLHYQHKVTETGDIVASRMHAVWDLFDRWTVCGYNKRNAKKPYGCKTFMNWLEEQGYFQADYLLLLIETEDH